MLFNSLAFVFFAAAFFGFWPLARRSTNVRFVYIVCFSFLFYGWWDWRYIFLLIITGLIDFWAGIAIDQSVKRKKAILLVSIGSNLATLAFFKYSEFLAVNCNSLLSWAGVSGRIPEVSVLLPVGISFYTFQSMSYTIDIYRGELKPTRNVWHFFSAISLFPHLVAGPIMRAQSLLEQLLESRTPTAAERWNGLRLIVHGFFKKMVIADNLASAVNGAFTGGLAYDSAINWWIIVSMFAMQIYCDFSGYSDIARGLAKWMGYEFSLNFQHPYCATSIKEFWGRWHMSLSTWFRDYVYVSLGGTRVGRFRGHVNMWTTMLLSGLWHGAAWHFVGWGAVHAAFLSIERVTSWPARVLRLPAGRVLAWGFLLIQVWVAWVFFRAGSLDQAGKIIGTMFSLQFAPLAVAKSALLFLGLGLAREIYCFYGLDWRRLLSDRAVLFLEPIIMGVIVAACIFFRGSGDAFIYFQF
jgi:D-alanyl-lipoteichoic acid acyltransferase DltB (MBOAT superfamily)